MRIVFILLLIFNFATIYAQKNTLQISASAGLSTPISSFNADQMFADRGLSFQGDLSYFFGKLGFGVQAGYFENKSQTKFNNYINHKYLENPNLSNMPSWQTLYALLGPRLKTQFGKLDFDLGLGAGLTTIDVPELIFYKTFFNQNYEIYAFRGSQNNNTQLAWSGSAHFVYNLTRTVGLRFGGQIIGTQYVSEVNYNNAYRDAADNNNNGKIDEPEYFESSKVDIVDKTPLSVFNIDLGMQIKFGGTHKSTKQAFTPAETVDIIPTTQVNPIETSLVEDNSSPLDKGTTITADTTIDQSTSPYIAAQIPTRQSSKVENNNPSISEQELAQSNNNEIQNDASAFDTDSAYDKEAAAFLYKAGEAYFAANDFEYATACFNKLKSDPNYPMAKYMFALSMATMGNCLEAKNEFNQFINQYTMDDKRTLEIIFASHIARCSEKTTKQQNTSQLDKDTKNISFRIQFIAIKKATVNFPKLQNIGEVTTEFYPDKALYRYVLGDYQNLDEAKKDMYHIRSLGYKDAFIAGYKDTQRISTLFHAH